MYWVPQTEEKGPGSVPRPNFFAWAKAVSANVTFKPAFITNTQHVPLVPKACRGRKAFLSLNQPSRKTTGRLRAMYIYAPMNTAFNE